MKKGILQLIIIFLALNSQAAIKIATWNLCHLGQTKSSTEIQTIAKLMKEMDIVAIQEVNTSIEAKGPQTAAQLLDELNRTGEKWDMALSQSTSVEENCGAKERYAYYWKIANVKLVSKAYLDQKLKYICCREPYIARFKAENKEFLVVNFHALRYDQQPEREVKYFKYIPERYPGIPIFFCGDWNLKHHHTVFFPLKKQGYHQILKTEKTTLKRSIDQNGNHLANSIDNILFPSFDVNKVAGGTIDLYHILGSLEKARVISDHLPVWGEFQFL